MEGVEGMLRGLKLSDSERKGVKVGKEEVEKTGVALAKAVGKLFSEKPGSATVIGQTLGRIWCPIKGLGCKELKENVFLFTFSQISGWKRATEDGPWWFDKELIVIEKFDPRKTTEDYLFNIVPIWVRIFGLPLGVMNRGMGERIGDIIGEAEEVDVGEDGNAVGKFLRVKIRMDITKPLMRGTVVDLEEERGENEEAVEVGEKVKELWCRFEYEHLPDFCYTCGIIGHGERDCHLRVKKGEKQQFGAWLRADVEGRRSPGGSRSRWSDGKGSNNMRQIGFGRSGSKVGSDGPSWRKEDDRRGEEGKTAACDDEENTSPTKTMPEPKASESQQQLNVVKGAELTSENEVIVAKEKAEINIRSLDGKDKVVEEVLEVVETGKKVLLQVPKISEGKKVEKTQNKFKRVDQTGRKRNNGDGAELKTAGQKRSAEETGKVGGEKKKRGDGMEIDDDGSVNQSEISAGLFEQPRRTQ
jgi:hypothetical protein